MFGNYDTHSYGMTLNTKWSNRVSCSAISSAEWFSKGSASPPTYRTQEKNITPGLSHLSGTKITVMIYPFN